MHGQKVGQDCSQFMLSLRETMKESDGDSVVIGIPADIDIIPAI
jgi:hypothetical protein